ncbi:hypothetical protein [Leifsonia kafniensis]|uniref:hypothetical protein n=1 Tax=Leifsonia kafniensis TaxID=475957 RepID=UPI0031EB9872
MGWVGLFRKFGLNRRSGAREKVTCDGLDNLLARICDGVQSGLGAAEPAAELIDCDATETLSKENILELVEQFRAPFVVGATARARLPPRAVRR